MAGQANVRALSAPSAAAKAHQEAAAAAAAAAMVSVPNSLSVPKRLADMGQMPVSFRSGTAELATVRVLCYGDSLTVGFFDNGRQYEPYGRALADALAAALNKSVEVLVCGQSGHTANEMARNLDAPVLTDVGGLLSKGLRHVLREQKQKPHLVLIMAGTNDLGREYKPPAVLADVRRLHAACHECGVPTVAMSPPPAPRALQSAFEENRRCLLGLLQKFAACHYPKTRDFINPSELVPAVLGSPMWDLDGLHFSPAGSKLLGQRLASFVAQVLR